MILPSPEILRKYRNTDGLVKSGRADLIPDLVAKFPGDYIDLASYESIKRAMQFK